MRISLKIAALVALFAGTIVLACSPTVEIVEPPSAAGGGASSAVATSGHTATTSSTGIAQASSTGIGSSALSAVATAASTSVASTGAGGSCAEHCAEIVADNTLPACTGSSAQTLYMAFVDCVCLPMNCGGNNACGASCATQSVPPSDACMSCAIGLTTSGCQAAFVACSNDSP